MKKYVFALLTIISIVKFTPASAVQVIYTQPKNSFMEGFLRGLAGQSYQDNSQRIHERNRLEEQQELLRQQIRMERERLRILQQNQFR